MYRVKWQLFLLLLSIKHSRLCCGGSRIVSWPEKCPQISKVGSNIISVVGTHSHKFSKHADMNACINGRNEEKCGGFAALQSDKISIWTWGSRGSGCKKLISPSPVSKIVTTDSAFAVLSESGEVVLAWGNPEHGGTLPSTDLTNVEDLYSNPYAFVALKKTGECVAWGDNEFGGEIPVKVSNEMLSQGPDKVHRIIPSTYAFAALKSVNSDTSNNMVIPWGHPEYGGLRIVQDCEPHELYPEVILCKNYTVDALMQGVKTLVANGYGFVAFMNEPGQLTSFGFREYGGNCGRHFSCPINGCIDDNDRVTHVIPSFANFVGLTKGGKAISCGMETWGWNEAKNKVMSEVVEIFSTHGAFAALKKDKTVVTWGDERNGGDSNSVRRRLTNVKSVIGNMLAFAALRENGEVVVWGNPAAGGNVEVPVPRCYVRYRRSMNGNVLVHIWVRLQLYSIDKIYAGSESFAAVRKDQGVITWGDEAYGAGLCMSFFTEANQVADQMEDWEKVVNIASSFAGFAAQIKADESLRLTLLEERKRASELAAQKKEVVIGSKGARSDASPIVNKGNYNLKWLSIGFGVAVIALSAFL